MDIKYIEEVIIPQRKKEIKEGKNEATAQPIYVVLDLEEKCVSGHFEDGRSPVTNLKNKQYEVGYIDSALDSEDMEFKKTDRKMKKPEKITIFYTDRIVSFFLTSEAAYDYLNYQKHNMSKEAYVYVFYSGYGNREMNMIFKNE